MLPPLRCALAFLLALLALAPAQAAPPSQAEARLYRIYKELIEIDTTHATGDTAKAARAMAAHLTRAGFARCDAEVFVTAPRKGNLVARLRGTGAARPMLLLAHLDVVPARREDWSTDPFKLVEQDGFYYARGTIDDKAMAAIFVDLLIRLKEEGFKPRRDIIVALTTDEETPDTGHNGVEWLLKTKRALIDAEFGLNEGGGGLLKDGKPLYLGVQTGEKLYANFWLSVRSEGGHSSLPPKDTAIYRLAAGLMRLQRFDFPVALNDTTRAYFARMAALEEGETARAMAAVAKDKPARRAVARLSATPRHNAQLRTTCVATRLEGGHADNALPQLARALVNCRILPSESADGVKATLARVLDDEAIAVETAFVDVPSAPSPMDGAVMAAMEKVAAEMWPGTPVIPVMSAGATDSRFLRNAGIPVYGNSGIFMDINENRIHGKDERVSVKAFYDAAAFQYRLVKALAGG